MLFTDKTFEKCIDGIKSGQIKAILFSGNNHGLATILADELTKIFQAEDKIFLDYQDDTKDNPFIQNLVSNTQDDFFSSKKLIKVFNIKTKRGIAKELSFLDTEPLNGKLILLFGTEIDGKCELKTFFEKGKQIACVNLYEDDEKTASSVIVNYFSKNNIKIENDAVKTMAEMLHGDRLALLCECEKMIYYCNGNAISADDVNNAIESEQEGNVFSFIDNLLAGNTRKATEEFSLLEKDDVQMIMLVRFFIKSVEEILAIKEDVLSGVDAESAIKSRFIFWKRVPLVKTAVSKSTMNLLKNYIKIALLTEKEAKIFGNEIAKHFFVRNAILFGVR